MAERKSSLAKRRDQLGTAPGDSDPYLYVFHERLVGIDWTTDRGTVSELTGLGIQKPKISQSGIALYRSCPRKYMWVQRFGLRPKGPRYSPALSVGQYYHKFIEDAWRGIPEEKTTLWCGDVNDKLLAEFKEQDGADLAYFEDEQRLERDLECNLVLARAMFTACKQYFTWDRERYETVMVEQRIVVRLKGLKRPIEGTLDRVIRDKRTNKYWIVDYKTTSDSAVDRSLTCPIETQGQLYRWLLAQVKPEWDCVGILHSIIQKPTIRFGREDRAFVWETHTFTRGKRKDETEQRKVFTDEVPQYHLYCERVARWYQSTGEYENLRAIREAENSYPFLESWTLFPEPLLNKEFVSTLFLMGKVTNSVPRLHRYPRSTGSCMAYRRPCKFLKLCTSNPGRWPDLIAEEFECVNVNEPRDTGKPLKGDTCSDKMRQRQEGQFPDRSPEGLAGGEAADRPD